GTPGTTLARRARRPSGALRGGGHLRGGQPCPINTTMSDAWSGGGFGHVLATRLHRYLAPGP
ncbi:MAG TPA: hypothetical protein VGW38_03475, partial [Chloroflexota bacterium]|nr:hypothetical protein [Chloroflexota bacterium]